MARPLFEIRKCKQCSSGFRATQANLRAGKAKFCSRRCAGLFRYAHHNHLKPNRRKTKTTWKPGDNLGHKHPRWREPLRFVCVQCHAEFFLKPWRARNPGQKNMFCSAACRSVYRKTHLSGPSAPDWAGGPKTYRGRGWLKARAAVVKRQKGYCALCRKYVGKSLPVHHRRPFREFNSIKKANHQSNLIGFCQSCHMQVEPRRPQKGVQLILPVATL